MYPQYPPPQGPPPPGYFQNNPWGMPPKPPENPMDLWKVVGINFGIFVVYQVLFLTMTGRNFLIADMFPLIVHWIAMLIFMIVSFSRGKRMAGFGWLISLILLIVIGFGSCWWIADTNGGPLF